MGQRVLKRFGHVERIDEYRRARRMLMAEVSGRLIRGRPRLGWMVGVKVVLQQMDDIEGCAKIRVDRME